MGYGRIIKLSQRAGEADSEVVIENRTTNN